MKTNTYLSFILGLFVLCCFVNGIHSNSVSDNVLKRLQYSIDDTTLLANIDMDHPQDSISAINNKITNSTINKTYTTTEQGTGYSGQDASHKWIVSPLIKSNICRNGSYGLEYILNKRLPGNVYDQNLKDRLETIILDRGDLNYFSNTIHYSGFSFRIPSTSGIVHSWFVIHQWHQSSPESPPIAFELKPGYKSRLQVAVRFGENKKHQHAQYLQRESSTHIQRFIDLPQDQWIDFVVRWRFSPKDQNGLLDVYIHQQNAPNSHLLFKYRGQIGYSNIVNKGITEKFGIYRGADSISSHQIYYDAIKLGTSYDSVKPW